MQDSHDLPGDQTRVLALLLAGKPITHAAKEVGVNPATIHGWLNTDPFRVAYRQARRAVMEQAVATMQGAAAEAAQTLVDIMQDKTIGAGIRYRVALSLIEHGIENDKLDRILARLEADE
jgi:hypothetical protein